MDHLNFLNQPTNLGWLNVFLSFLPSDLELVLFMSLHLIKLIPNILTFCVTCFVCWIVYNQDHGITNMKGMSLMSVLLYFWNIKNNVSK
jgi:hypothetical protein